MKTEFLQPRFTGARFDEHTLPVEVLRDLAAYETLVVELAKHLYLQEHQKRERVPKGFTADFQIHLERVDEGSAKPLLSIVTAAALFATYQIYFERARDIVTECVAATDGKIPANFPIHLLNHFNQFGRSLKEGETMELISNGGTSTLTPQRRKELVLAVDRVYEKEIELNGVIEEMDWKNATFRLRLQEGSSMTVPMPKSFEQQARTFGGRPRHQLIVKGIGLFDLRDQLQKILSVDSLDIQPNYELADRLEEIAQLKDGWYDGEGVAPSVQNLTSLTDALLKYYPESLPLPPIVPTPDGNLLFEWTLPGDPSIDFELEPMTAYFHAFQEGSADIEQTFLLQNEEDWIILFQFLKKTLQITPA